MANLTKAICVWLDSDSDRDNPAWIVSLDRLDVDGGAVTTKTLSVHDDMAEALAEAMEQGRRFDLAVYNNPPDGPAELLAPAPTPEE